MKVLITGISGSGKSTVIAALRERGYAAYNTDDLPEVTQLEDLATGLPVDWPTGSVDFSRYGWHWQEKGLQNLLASAPTVFVGAAVSNQTRFYSLFDKIFVLTIDAKTLEQRLQSRTTNTYGKRPEELSRILKIHEQVEAEHISLGALPIDATKQLDEVVAEIIVTCEHEPVTKEV